MNQYGGEGWFIDNLNRFCWLMKYVLVYLLIAAIAVYIVLAMATGGDKPSGRCEQEPGPNNITITTCEGE